MQLYIKQKVFSWSDRFTVKDAREQDRYFVQGEMFSWGKRLHVFDAQGRERAFVRQRLMSWMPRYYVEIDGREVCQVAKRFAFFRNDYVLEGLDWVVEGDFWAHEYSMYSGGQEVMRLSKEWFSWGDSYALDIADERDELLCLCVVLAIDAAIEQSSSRH